MRTRSRITLRRSLFRRLISWRGGGGALPIGRGRAGVTNWRGNGRALLIAGGWAGFTSCRGNGWGVLMEQASS